MVMMRSVSLSNIADSDDIHKNFILVLGKRILEPSYEKS